MYRLVNKQGLTYALINKTNNIIPIIPENISTSIKVLDNSYFKNANKDIFDDVKRADNRIIELGKIEFENETYQHLKYEIGQFLNLKSIKSSYYLKEIYSIIDNYLMTLSKKRELLKVIIQEIIEMLVVMDNISIDDLPQYINNAPKKRIKCNSMVNKIVCNKSYHCRWDTKKQNKVILGGKCKMLMANNNMVDNKENLEKYSSLLTEEIVRNNIKRKQILEGKVSDVIYPNNIDIGKNEIILNESTLTPNIIKQLFSPDLNPYYNELNLYDYLNPDILNTNILFNISEKFEYKLPKYWQMILKKNYIVNHSDDYPDSGWDAIAIGLQYLYKKVKIDKQTVINKWLEYIHTLDNDKWRDILENYQKNNYINKHLKKNIKSFDDFTVYIKSNLHWINIDDIEILTKVYPVNIAIIGRKNVNNPNGLIIKGSKKTETYILLNSHKLRDNITKYEIIHLNNQYIFRLNELSREFVTIIKQILHKTFVILYKNRTKSNRSISNGSIKLTLKKNIKLTKKKKKIKLTKKKKNKKKKKFLNFF